MTAKPPLQVGDIAIGKFAAATTVKSSQRELGSKLVGTLLEPHPLLVLAVDPQKQTATVMLLGSDREGNSLTATGFTPQEQKLAKLDKPSVFKPHSLSVMPLDHLDAKGGRVTEATLGRIHTHLERAIRDKTLTMTHLARDGEIATYDFVRGKVGQVILESPTKTASALKTAHVAETALHTEAVVQKGAGLAELGRDVVALAKKEVTHVAGGPVGDAWAVGDASMALVGLIDKHTGHALTEGPLGKAVAYVGEHSGAFHAVYALDQMTEPYRDRFHHTVDPYIDRASALAEAVANKTGLTAAAHHVDHLASRAEDWTAQQLDKVQQLYHDTLHSAGLNVPPLSRDEAKALAHELGQVKPGEALAVDRTGSLTLVPAGAAVPQHGTLLLDAHAFKEQAGLTGPGHGQAAPAPPAPAAHTAHVGELSR